MSGVPRSSVLRPVLFIVYMDVGFNSFTSNFADDKKIGKSIIDDLDRLPSRKIRKKYEIVQNVVMHLHVNKCHIPKVGANNKKKLL